MSDVVQQKWAAPTQGACPFCGCPQVSVREFRRQMMALCFHCGAQGPRVYAREISKNGLMWARAEAVRRWNQREAVSE